jgi:UDP-2,3-diacylglucosamine hydrolase
MAKVYFLSDIHLGFETKEKERARESLLIRFLDRIESNAEKLYIVGDLFDYWFEYRTVIPRGYHRLLTKLDEILNKGIEINYLMGNHDFYFRDFFSNELGVRIFGEPIVTTLGGKKFYITHGDELAEKDLGYKILKRLLRNRFSQLLYSLVHPDLGIWLAKHSSQKSRDYTSWKRYGEGEGLVGFAERKISEGFDYVVMGHRHVPIFQRIGNGFYVNLGDWVKHYTYAVFDGEKVELLQMELSGAELDQLK